jgi:predicted nucleic acid-binding protein
VKLVVDTSAILGVLLNQGPKEWLVASTTGATLIAPVSLHWEIGNALSSLLKRKKITEKEADNVLDAYEKIPIQFVEADLKASLALVSKHLIYAYNAYMLVCAKQFKIPLISLDKGLVEVAKKEHVRVLEA